MKNIVFFFVFLPFCGFTQEPIVARDTIPYEYYIIKGDTLPTTSIDLEPVFLLPKLSFKTKEDRRQYLILRRKTLKVYPYAKLAAERLETFTERLQTITKKRHKRIYAKRVQQYIEDEFSAELKKLTRTEGQILIKLIHRQTGKTTFQLIKELRSGWNAFWFNNTASLFDLSLKREFDPNTVAEDYLIEDILQRSFQNGLLVKQEDALNLDFFALSEKWMHSEKKDK